MASKKTSHQSRKSVVPLRRCRRPTGSPQALFISYRLEDLRDLSSRQQHDPELYSGRDGCGAWFREIWNLRELGAYSAD